MVGRGRLLVVNHGEHHRRRLQKRNMGEPLHSHFSNDTLRSQEDHLFSRTGQAFFCFVSFLFFFLFFAFFFFFGTRLLTLRNLRYVATRLVIGALVECWRLLVALFLLRSWWHRPRQKLASGTLLQIR